MDALQRVRLLLDRITYKPGWQIEARRINDYSPWDKVTLMVSCLTRDVNSDNETRVVSCFSLEDLHLDRMDDQDIVKHFIRRAIWQLEEHESDEWLKFDKVCVVDPHPELGVKTA